MPMRLIGSRFVKPTGDILLTKFAAAISVNDREDLARADTKLL